MRIHTVVALCSIPIIVACVSSPPQTASSTHGTLDALIIKNATEAYVSDVRLQDIESGTFVTCNSILPGYDCTLGFEVIKNEGHEAILSWSQHGQTYKRMLPKNPKTASHPEYPNKAVVKILDNGRLELTLE